MRRDGRSEELRVGFEHLGAFSPHSYRVTDTP